MSTVEPLPITSHEEAAQKILIELRLIAKSVAGYTHVPVARFRKISTTAAVPDDFLQACAVACDANAQLAAASDVTGAELRDVIGFSRAYLSVADELELLARGLRGTVAVRRGEIAQRARRVYSMAKSMNLPVDRDRLVPHITEMKRTLNKTRVKRAPAADPPVDSATPKFKAGKDLSS
jgi:hypothetical protein